MNYNFKVKVSDYKKVIALVDTDIKGKLFTFAVNGKTGKSIEFK